MLEDFPERPISFDNYANVYNDVACVMDMSAGYLKVLAEALKSSESRRFTQKEHMMVQGGFDQLKYGSGMLKRMTSTYVDPVTKIVWNDWCGSCNLRTLLGFGGDPTDCGVYSTDENGNVLMRRHNCVQANQNRGP